MDQVEEERESEYVWGDWEVEGLASLPSCLFFPSKELSLVVVGKFYMCNSGALIWRGKWNWKIVEMGGNGNGRIRFPVKTPLLHDNITELYFSSEVSCVCMIYQRTRWNLSVYSAYSMQQTWSTQNTIRWREMEGSLGYIVLSVISLLCWPGQRRRCFLNIPASLLAPFFHRT